MSEPRNFDVITSSREPVVGGVLFLHWFDPQADDGNRTQFAVEAQALAATGVVSVLPQLEFPWSADPTESTSDAAQIALTTTRRRSFSARLRIVRRRWPRSGFAGPNVRGTMPACSNASAARSAAS